MRDYGTDINSHLATMQGLRVRHLVWIEAKNRETGSPETLGLWNGGAARVFNIGGTDRTYQGAGGLLGLDSIVSNIGLQVRRHTIAISRIPPEVVNLIHLYDARLAPVEAHRVFFDSEKGVQIGDPVRVLKGTIDEMPVPRPPIGGSQTIRMTVASASRSLTRTLTSKKSDEAQRRAFPGDRGREYAGVSGAVRVSWGEKDKRGASLPAAAPPSGVVFSAEGLREK